MKVELRVDRKEKLFALYLDNILRAKWRDSDDNFNPKGKGICFMTYGRVALMLSVVLLRTGGLVAIQHEGRPPC